MLLVGFVLRKLYEKDKLKINSKPYVVVHVRLKAYPWPIHSTMQLPGASIIWPGRPFKIRIFVKYLNAGQYPSSQRI